MSTPRKTPCLLRLAPAILLAACTLSGCAHVRSSMHSVVSDLTDVLRADVSGSVGTDMGAHLMATKYVQLKSYSYEDLHRLGLTSRMMGLWDEERETNWVGPWPLGRQTLQGTLRSVKLGTTPPRTPVERITETRFGETADEVGLGVHFLFGGARLGLRPWEFVDLLANFVFLDPCDDNVTWDERRKLRDEAKARAASESDALPAVPEPAPQPSTKGKRNAQ